ncbi:glycosyltransferase family 2 protein [Roseovarius albus]|uniref:glycosyltransferase family 2 protein n=1 Tax=Roseovarius albus TaxID=1247867 RepID=UPI001F23C476|nr:glycosyltransferase family 2 protein [Roseovarius albus]
MNTSKLSDTAQILVSVINYRTAELTIQCVQSVLDDMQGIEGRVVIVDNASNDGSVEKLRTWISSLEQKEQVNLLEATSNSGFSGGHNQGILSQSADFYLILNSDAVLRPGFLSSMLNAAAQNPTIGLFAPKIEHDTGEVQTSCFRFHSPLSELARGAESGPVSKLLRTREVALAMPPSPDSIEWASFACILLRRETWSDTGPMDTGYFLYFEDVEYCWRARKAGWRIAYVQNAVGVHFRGGSGPVKSLAQERKRLPRYYYASRTRMLYQFYGWFGLVTANLCWCFGRVVARLRLLVGKSIPQSNRSEWRDIWTNVFSPLGNNYAKKD